MNGMDWATAYCAPGRKLAASLALMLQGERAAEIVEHPWLAGNDSVILVREPVFELLPVTPLAPAAPAERCLFCDGLFWRHRTYCPIMRPPEPGPLCVITGLQ